MIVAWTRLQKHDNPHDKSNVTTGGLDAFLAAGCLGVSGRVLTVREVILANAHVKGNRGL